MGNRVLWIENDSDNHLGVGSHDFLVGLVQKHGIHEESYAAAAYRMEFESKFDVVIIGLMSMGDWKQGKSKSLYELEKFSPYLQLAVAKKVKQVWPNAEVCIYLERRGQIIDIGKGELCHIMGQGGTERWRKKWDENDFQRACSEAGIKVFNKVYFIDGRFQGAFCDWALDAINNPAPEMSRDEKIALILPKVCEAMKFNNSGRSDGYTIFKFSGHLSQDVTFKGEFKSKTLGEEKPTTYIDFSTPGGIFRVEAEGALPNLSLKQSTGLDKVLYEIYTSAVEYEALANAFERLGHSGGLASLRAAKADMKPTDLPADTMAGGPAAGHHRSFGSRSTGQLM